MKQALLRLLNWGWRLCVAGLIVVLLAVAGTRMLIASLPFFQQQITQYLSDQLSTSLQVEHLHAQWHGGIPTLTIRGLTLRGSDAEKPGLMVDRVDLEINLRNSLLQGTPVFKRLNVDGVFLEVIQSKTGHWRFSGIENIAFMGSSGGYSKPALLDWLRYQGILHVSNTSLSIVRPEGRMSSLRTPYFSLTNDEGIKRLNARFELGAGSVEISGSGLGTASGGMGWSGLVSVKDIDLEQTCALWSGCNDRLQKAPLAAEMTWYYNDGHWQVAGNVAAPGIVYQTDSGKEHSLVGKTGLFIDGIRGKNWKLWLNDFSLTVDQQQVLGGNWYLAGDKTPEYAISVAREQLDLEPVKNTLVDLELLPAPAERLLKTLNPRGHINNLALRFYPGRKPFDFDLSAGLEGVAVDAWHGAPSAGGVTGELRMSLLKGYLDLDSQQFSLGFPEVFRKVWHYDSAQSRLYWDVVDNTYVLKSDQIKLVGDEGSLTGKLKLDIPLDGEPLSMALTVGLKNGHANYAKKYIPARLDNLSDQLVEWLDSAIKQADISEGGFLYNGVLKKTEETGDSRWGLYFNIDDAEFDYHEDWPEATHMSGGVYVNSDRVEMLARSADVLGARLRNVLARVPLAGETVVYVRARTTAKKDTLHRFLTETPINDLMEGEAKTWQLTGDLDALLQLTIPISHAERSDIRVRGQANNFLIGFPEYNVVINGINGDVAFSTRKGLTAKSLKGELFGKAIDASISSVIENNSPVSTEVQWRGVTGIDSIQQWLDLSAFSMFNGEAAYQADLLINHKNETTTLDVTSNLQGVAVDLPEPLYKKPDSQLPFALNYIVKPDGNDLTVRIESLGKVLVGFNTDSTVKQASILMGDGAEADVGINMFDGKSGSILVSGFIPELDLAPWYTRFGQSSANASYSRRVIIQDLRIGELHYDDYNLDNVQVGLKSDEQSQKLTVYSKSVAGSLWIPERDSQPYRLILDHLLLPERNDEEKLLSEKGEKLSVSPLSIPAADISIDSLTAGHLKNGKLAFKLRPMPDGVKIESLQGEMSGMTLQGAADWIENKGEQHTSFQGSFEGGELERFQEDLGVSPFIRAKKSELTGQLNWSGSPMDVGFSGVSGTVGLHLRNGKLKKLEGGAGALKLFGILNTESLTRRLRLDFSDLYSSGISFDDLNGVLRFDKGGVTFDSPIVIEGPSSNFKLDGLVDANKETMDLSFVVTLPVSSNLPIFSFLLGAAPQVAGIFYIADKLVGKQVDQLASIRYRVNGSFDDPEVSLDKLFSNKAKKPKKKK